MIFGKSYKEKHKQEQEALEYLYNNRLKSFAWLPTKLETGEWVWLQTVYKKYYVYKIFDYRADWNVPVEYYLTKD